MADDLARPVFRVPDAPLKDRLPHVRPRYALPALRQHLEMFPVVMLQGPRGAGKTTLAQQVAKSKIDFSNRTDVELFEINPKGLLENAAKPVLIDEWQINPSSLWHIKHLVDEGLGGFIVAGSAGHYEPDSAHSRFPLVGRCSILRVPVLSWAEQNALLPQPLAEGLLAGDMSWAQPQELDHTGYLAIAMSTGYPAYAGMKRSDAASAMQNMGQQVLQFYMVKSEAIAERGESRRAQQDFLRAQARMSGRIVSLSTLTREAGIAERTAAKYRAMFSDCFICDDIDVWRPSPDAAPSRFRKVFINDPGLQISLSGLSEEEFLSAPSLIGGLMETFVLTQLRAQQSAAADRYDIMCYNEVRTKQGARSAYPLGEIDFVLLDRASSRLAAIEVKSGASPGKDSFERMRKLRDAMDSRPATTTSFPPKRFTGGIVLHCGRGPVLQADDRIWVAPMSTLWAD
ncbi:MAG: DUF4143 domain-containing protein [bacterium]|nr:DUF4143 domain-containing protein [bacterium]